MADVTANPPGNKKHPKTFQKKPLRIDLTPLVDLGFLLITFFIFTTVINQPTVMKLVLPQEASDDDNRMTTKESGTLTLLPAGDKIVYYYEGANFDAPGNLRQSDDKKVRDIILAKKRSVADKDLFIQVKPLADCSYQNLVNMLDEMRINDVKAYALVDVSMAEIQRLTDQSTP